MKFKLGRFSLALASAAVLSVTGCGGSSSDSANNSPSSQPAPTTLSGTTAIGQPIIGTVVAIDINGKVSSPATTSDTGAYVLDVGGLTAPYILTVIGTAGGKQVTLNSIATAAGQTVNITPLTDLIVSTAAGQPAGSTLAELCTPVNDVVTQDCLSALTAAATPTNLTAAVTAVKDMIAPLNTAGTDPLNGTFTADGTGFDALLDQILVSPAAEQGATATITLIATNTPLGTVTLPATPGQASTPTTNTLDTQTLAAANAAAAVLPEIRACLASFNKLYEKTGFTAPSQVRVEDFLDNTFLMGRNEDKSAFAAHISGGGEGAVPGFSMEAVGLSPFDMSPLTSAEKTNLSSTTVVAIVKARATGAITYTNGSPTSAWIQLKSSTDAGTISMKMVKGAAYDGCAGGWKFAGTKHLEMHMNTRINRTLNGSSEATFTREWAFHVEKEAAEAEMPSGATLGDVIVKGPGLTTYSGVGSAPATAGNAPLTLTVSSDSSVTWLVIGNGTTFYGNSDAIQSCQDLVGTNAPQGTPCIDETQVAPGKLYSWIFKGVNATPAVVAAFPFQINAVPLSKTFAKANQSALFATVTSITPAGISALNAALSNFASGSALDNLFTINYTQQSATYGSRMDNCNIGLFIGGTAVLRAEQNAVGAETACTFKTSGLNSGSLVKPTGTIEGGYISVTTNVLGNQATSSQPY